MQPPQATIQNTLELLRRQYVAALPDKLKAIQDAWQSLQCNWDSQTLQNCARAIHSLRGSAATYGCAALGQAAEPLDNLLLSLRSLTQPPQPPQMAELQKLMEALQAAGQQIQTLSMTQIASRPIFRLSEAERSPAGYLELQLRQIEANWKALHWAWEPETLRQILAQLRTVLINLETFQFTTLRTITSDLLRYLESLHQRTFAPTPFELGQLQDQMGRMLQPTLLRDRTPFKIANPSNLVDKPLVLLDEDQNHAGYLEIQLNQLELQWQALQWDWRSDMVYQFAQQDHYLGMNAAQAGYGRMAKYAGALEHYLLKLQKQGGIPGSAEITEINRGMDTLRNALEAGPSQADNEPDTPADTEAKPKLIYVVDDDPIITAFLAEHLRQQNYRVEVFHALDGLTKSVTQNPPDALIVDIVMAEGSLAGPQAMYRLQKGRARPLPVIFMSARKDMQARMAAAQASGDAYFTKPIDIDGLLKKLVELTSSVGQNGDAYRVLIVDNTGEEYAARYAQVLQQENMQVKILTTPARVLEAIEKFAPSLALIHVRLNGVQALKLGRVIRQQPQYANLPMVFYAQKFEETWRTAVMEGVGDDFLSDKTLDAQVVATVVNRIRFARKQARQ